MNDIPLSSQTRLRISRIFPAETREEAAQLLVTQCGRNIPDYSDATPVELERIRFAALKLSNGTIDRLVQAIELAETDWRDLLVAADFADDAKAHTRWLLG